MKVFVKDANMNGEIILYGMDGSDITELYMVCKFGEAFNRLTEKEKAMLNTDADYSIPLVCYNELAKKIDDIQDAIYDAADYIEATGEDESIFEINGVSCVTI